MSRNLRFLAILISVVVAMTTIILMLESSFSLFTFADYLWVTTIAAAISGMIHLLISLRNMNANFHEEEN